MIVVADASPLNYLVQIGAVQVLEVLYESCSIQTRRRLFACGSRILRIRYPDPQRDANLRFLDSGESAAITLTEAVNADRVLIDERAGRDEARRRGLEVTGTVGVLAEAHLRGLLDFDSCIKRLRGTNFYVSSDLITHIRQRLFTTERR